MAAASGTKASSMAARRLRHDFENIQKSPNPQIIVMPSEDDLLQWHFVLHSFPDDTPYHGGVYHGRINFPPEYPHAPPAIMMVTPSGRLAVEKRLCLSMTDYHPESWNPAWSVETILVGLLSFFISDVEDGLGAIKETADTRRRLAAESSSNNAKCPEFQALFAGLLSSQSGETQGQSPDEQAGAEHLRQGAADTCIVESHPRDFPEDFLEEPETSPEVLRRTSSSVTVAAGKDNVMAIPLLATTPPDTETQEAANRPDDNDEETLQECWICRDTEVDEPLIQPCACRGSMSGVHASCAEQWIRHYRQNAVNDEPPRCAVCNEFYHGSEVRPGVGTYVRNVGCTWGAAMLKGFASVPFLLAFFWGTRTSVSIWVRVPLLLSFYAFALYLILVWTVSMPQNRTPPQNRCMHIFFVSGQAYEEYQCILYVMLMLLTTLMRIDDGAAMGSAPVMCFCLMPMVKGLSLLCRQCDQTRILRCLKYTFLAPLFLLGCVIAAPFLLVGAIGYILWTSRHPLDVSLHIVFLGASIGVMFLETCVPYVIVAGVHSVFFALAIIEKVSFNKLKWRTGPRWIIPLYIAIFATIAATFPTGGPLSHGFGNTVEQNRKLVSCVSVTRFLLMVAFIIVVHWSAFTARISHNYRTWQNRNGSFRLEIEPVAQLEAEPAAQV